MATMHWASLQNPVDADTRVFVLTKPWLALLLAWLAGGFLDLGACNLLPAAREGHQPQWLPLMTLLGSVFIYGIHLLEDWSKTDTSIASRFFCSYDEKKMRLETWTQPPISWVRSLNGKTSFSSTSLQPAKPKQTSSKTVHFDQHINDNRLLNGKKQLFIYIDVQMMTILTTVCLNLIHIVGPLHMSVQPIRATA